MMVTFKAVPVLADISKMLGGLLSLSYWVRRVYYWELQGVGKENRKNAAMSSLAMSDGMADYALNH